MHWMAFKGIHSKDFNVIIESLGRRKRAEEEIEIHDIPYRNGVLTTRTGKYKTYERAIGIAVKSREEISRVNAWLTGSGELRTSIDEGGFFKAECIGGLEYSKIIKRWNRFYANFLIQPFFYLDSGQKKIELTEPGSINNTGTIYSEPLIKVFATGDVVLNINDKFIGLNGIMDHAVIDTDLMIAYEDTQNVKTEGEFPVFGLGINNISWDESISNISKIEIIPRWREL